jgi:hypothetical protein
MRSRLTLAWAAVPSQCAGVLDPKRQKFIHVHAFPMHLEYSYVDYQYKCSHAGIVSCMNAVTQGRADVDHYSYVKGHM